MPKALLSPPPKVPKAIAVLLLRSTRKAISAFAGLTKPGPVVKAAARIRWRTLKEWLSSVMAFSGKAKFGNSLM
jgi:hypothetical protein